MKITLTRYDLALALCAQVSASMNRRKARRPGPTNNTTLTAPRLSLLGQYAALHGAAKFSFFQAHSAELFAQFKKGVK